MGKIKRSIIDVDEEKCTGCALCIPGCPEGALKIVDTENGPKARLVKDIYCDGLGACLGNCPEGALTITEDSVEEYDEEGVVQNILDEAPEKIGEHLDHLMSHNERKYLMEAVHFLKSKNFDLDFSPYQNYMRSPSSHAGAVGGCPGSRIIDMSEKDIEDTALENRPQQSSRLKNWPVQIMLANPAAPYFKNADILVAADCTPFAYADFHEEFIKNKVVLVGCPKLDDLDFYKEKLANIFRAASPNSITVLHMEVPCCSGIVTAVKSALESAGRNIPFCDITITLKGEKK